MKCRALFICSMVFFVALPVGRPYAGDLLEMYRTNDTNAQRGELSYGFGASLPPAFKDANSMPQGGTVLGAHLNSNKKGCGFDVVGDFQAMFDSKALNSYISGAGQSLIQGAGLMGMCYASQTLCDIYKFVRSSANFLMDLRSKQCQEVEKIAMQTGTALASEAVMECVQEKRNAGQSVSAAMDDCANAKNINNPFSGGKGVSYNLTDELTKRVDNPTLSYFLQGVLGDVTVDANAGVHAGKYYDNYIDQYASYVNNKYYSAISASAGDYIKTGTVPDADALKTMSIPGFRLTPFIFSKLREIDPDTREHFYRSYSTYASLFGLLNNIRATEETINKAEEDANNKELKDYLEKVYNRLEREYKLYERQLALQKDFLAPMFQSLVGYKSPPASPDITKEDIGVSLPRPIWKNK